MENGFRRRGYMKKVFLVLFSLLFIVSCDRTGDKVDNVNKKINKSQNQYQYAQQYNPWTIAESDNYYYHISGNFLYAISKKDGKIKALDNNPDSLADKETDINKLIESNAFFHSPRSVYYNDNKLYVLASKKKLSEREDTDISDIYEDCLYEVNTDGSGQKELFLPGESIYEAFIHEGYFYYSTSNIWQKMDLINSGNLEKDSLENLDYRIQRVALDNIKGKPELIYKQKGAGYIPSMKVYEDYLHFSDYKITSDEKDDKKVVYEYTEKICNLRNFEVEEAVKVEQENPDLKINKSSIVPVDDGMMYIYSLVDKKQEEESSNLKPEEQIDRIRKGEVDNFESNFVKAKYDGTILEEFKMSSNLHPVAFLNGYGKYLCLDNLLWSKNGLADTRELQILNTKGELLDEVTPPENAGMIIGMDNDYIYVGVQNVQESTGQIIDIYRVNLNKIGTDEFKFELFFTRSGEK